MATEAPASRERIPGRGGLGTSSRLRTALLLVPAAVALLGFFILPIAQIFWRSVTEPEFGFANYVRLATDGTTVGVLLRTLVVAIVVVAVTLFIAYPYTYLLTLVSPRWRAVMFTVILIPFWTSMLARNYAWLILMQADGVIDRAFTAVGIHGVVLMGTTVGVAVVMIQVLLPFMVLPLYSVMQQIDLRTMDAAQSLGASRLRSFLAVYLPLSRGGIASGCSLVFVFVLGFFLTPALIGSPQQALFAQLIAVRTRVLLDFPGAGAMGLVLLVVTLAVLALGNRLGGRGIAVTIGGAAKSVARTVNTGEAK